MEKFIIDWEKLEDIGYVTNLGKSLKNTLHKFNKDELFEELFDMIQYFTSMDEEAIPYENRIKSIQSCDLKYSKYYPNVPVEKAFNDILGIRITISDYSIYDLIKIPENVRIADMRNGKANDDGYRGIHLYIQKSHFHYPVEVQFVTEKDKIFNQLLHDNLYKQEPNPEVGKKLRMLYDSGKINNEEDFRKEYQNVLLNCKKI